MLSSRINPTKIVVVKNDMNLEPSPPAVRPLINVVMPVFNSAAFLAESIESILSQSYKDFEFIILNDGSTDRSWEIIQEYALTEKRIRTVQNATNMGIFLTRNLGLEMSTSLYVAVMDSDDISLPDRFEKQVAFLESHPDIDVLGGQIVKIGNTTQSGKKSNYPLTPGGIRWGLFSGCQLAHPTVMMRGRLFADEGFRYKEFTVAQDYDLWTRLAPGHKIANLPDVLVQYRIHQASISQTKYQIQKDETVRIVKDYIKGLTGEELPESIVKGLILTKDLLSKQDALGLYKFLQRLQRQSRNWELDQLGRSEIFHQAAYKLTSVYDYFKRDPRLIPLLINAGLLEFKSRWSAPPKSRKNVN